jgi:hypothetical protein
MVYGNNTKTFHRHYLRQPSQQPFEVLPQRRTLNLGKVKQLIQNQGLVILPPKSRVVSIYLTPLASTG